MCECISSSWLCNVSLKKLTTAGRVEESTGESIEGVGKAVGNPLEKCWNSPSSTGKQQCMFLRESSQMLAYRGPLSGFLMGCVQLLHNWGAHIKFLLALLNNEMSSNVVTLLLHA